jgi:hypothetical protein
VIAQHPPLKKPFVRVLAPVGLTPRLSCEAGRAQFKCTRTVGRLRQFEPLVRALREARRFERSSASAYVVASLGPHASRPREARRIARGQARSDPRHDLTAGDPFGSGALPSFPTAERNLAGCVPNPSTTMLTAVRSTDLRRRARCLHFLTERLHRVCEAARVFPSLGSNPRCCSPVPQSTCAALR